MKYKLSGLVGVLCLISVSAFSQSAVLKGDIKGFTEKQLVFYFNPAGSKQIVSDTVVVNSGKFTWTAKMPEPSLVRVFHSKGMLQFYAQAGKLIMIGTADSLRRVKVKGSAIQNESVAFENSLQDISNQQSALYKNYGKGSKEEQLALEKQIEELRIQRKLREKAYVKAHPSNFFSALLVLEKASGYGADYYEVNSMFESLDKKLQSSKTAQSILEKLEVAKRSNIGEPLKDFVQQDTAGNNVNLVSFRGKYVLLDFWASWCGPCRAENPNVLKAYNEYKDKGFVVVGVSLDDKKKNWVKAINDDKMPWTQLSDLKGSRNEVTSYYGIVGIPSNFLIDPSGKIVARNLMGEILHAKLKELLN